MSDEQIMEMYLFDLEWFKSKRRYFTHTQAFTPSVFDDSNDNNSENVFYKRFAEAFSVAMDKYISHSPSLWIEDIEDPLLVQKLKRLSTDDLELLTLFAFYGYTLTEIGRIFKCTPQNIQQKYKRIKNSLF